jgi:undecaprenyl-diphosphatase
MPDFAELIHHWGYPAIFLVEVLGNLGLPIPEETVLAVAGYLVWQGRASLPAVLIAAGAGAVVGDNLGYWLGRRYGRHALDRWVPLGPERVERMSCFVARYGMAGVFVARFVPGLRAVAGLLAGSVGLGPWRFFIANLASAMVYVPLGIGAGYALGYGLGEQIERLRRLAGDTGQAVAVLLAIALLAAWLALAVRRRA